MEWRGTNKDLDAGGIGNKLLDLGSGLLEGREGDVGHQDGGTLLGEEDGGLEANATGVIVSAMRDMIVSTVDSCDQMRQRWDGQTHPAAPVMTAFLPARRPRDWDPVTAGIVDKWQCD